MINLYAPDHLTAIICAISCELGLDEYDADIYVDYENLDDLLGASYGDNEAVVISLSEELEGELLVYAICHELVHARQMLSGDLSIDNEIMWRGEDMENVPYADRPYEHEAYYLETVLVQRLKSLGVPAIPDVFWRY